MLPKVFSKSLTAGSANCIALSQTVAAGANAILNGGSAAAGAFTLDTSRRIAIVSSADDSAKTARISGASSGGQPVSELLALTNAGTAVSVLNYAAGGTVKFPSGTAGNVTIGTNGSGSTDWAVPNYNMTPFNLDITMQLSGSVTWAFETTNDLNFWDPPKGQGATTLEPNVNIVVAATTVAEGITLTEPVTGYRFTISSGTGTLTAQALQAGVVNY
jgi:hypothetical protein